MLDPNPETLRNWVEEREGLSPGGWQDFEVVSRETPHGGARLTVPAQVGYPYRLWLLVTYALTEQGLTISVEATNTGPDPAPFGASIHPYLGAGAGVVDGWVLELPAARVLTVTADRLVPVDLRPVAELDRFDFRRPRTIADTFVDHAFTDLSAGPGWQIHRRLTGAGRKRRRYHLGSGVPLGAGTHGRTP
jgi:aldose 1-epimerase